MNTENDKPIKGPEVRWNKNDLKAMVKRFGRERAIEMLSGETFKQSYIKHIFKILDL